MKLNDAARININASYPIHSVIKTVSAIKSTLESKKALSKQIDNDNKQAKHKHDKLDKLIYDRVLGIAMLIAIIAIAWLLFTEHYLMGGLGIIISVGTLTALSIWTDRKRDTQELTINTQRMGLKQDIDTVLGITNQQENGMKPFDDAVIKPNRLTSILQVTDNEGHDTIETSEIETLINEVDKTLENLYQLESDGAKQILSIDPETVPYLLNGPLDYTRYFLFKDETEKLYLYLDYSNKHQYIAFNETTQVFEYVQNKITFINDNA